MSKKTIHNIIILILFGFYKIKLKLSKAHILNYYKL